MTVPDCREELFADLLAQGVRELGLHLDRRQLGGLELYCRELWRWNARVNLVARHTAPADLVVNHFLDSLTLVRVLARTPGAAGSGRVLDIGSGAGFPGLVLALAMGGYRFILVEARQKRCAFLAHMIRLLGLDNVELVASRLEEAPWLRQAGCRFIISRGVAPPARLLDLVRPLLVNRPYIVLMMGATGCRRWRQEPVTGFQLHGCHQVRLPLAGGDRTIAVVQPR